MSNIENFIFILMISLAIICLLNINENFENDKNNKNNKNMISLEIKKIKPEIEYNTNAEIVFVSAYTPNILPYAQYSILNLLAYAKKYNYGLIIYNQVLNNQVYPCWNKVAAILENLSKCKYLVWMDADAIISNFSIPIKSFIERDPNYDLYLCMDIFIDKECINSGVMIIKNTQWANNLFKKVWNSEIPHYHNDQNVIWHEIMKEMDPDVPIKLKYPKYCVNFTHPKVKILPENDFNSNIYNYKPNDFVLHLMGVKMDCRINIMRQINTKMGIDNYDKTDCMDILELRNRTDNKTTLINKICLKKMEL